MHDKRVLHGIHMRNLTKMLRRAIIGSSMFLKDKYFVSGVFKKFKARLVAEGDLAAPTTATAKKRIRHGSTGSQREAGGKKSRYRGCVP